MLQAFASAGFNVTPLSRLQSFAITGDAAILPPRPLVITIDDGSQSVLKLFHPRARETKIALRDRARDQLDERDR